MSQAADILYVADVDDRTGDFFTQMHAQFDQMQADLNRIQQKQQGYSQATEQGNQKAAAAFGLVSGIVSGLTGQLINMGMQAVTALGSFTRESIQLAARADTLAISLRQVGQNAGYTQEELTQFETQIRDQGITILETREMMIKLIGAQIDLSQAAGLARVAQNLAVKEGVNSSVMLGRLTHAILTLNTAILSDVGLNVNLQGAYKATADQMGTTAQALDYTTKKQIALQEVMRAAAPMMGMYEAAMGSAGKQAGSLERIIEDLKVSWGSAFQPAYGILIEEKTRVLKELHKWFNDNADAIKQFGYFLGDAVRIMIEAARVLLKLAATLSPVHRLLTGLPGVIKTAGTELAGLAIGSEEAGKRAENLGMIWNQAMSIIAGAITYGVTLLKEMVGAIADVFKAVQGLGPAWKWQAGEIDAISAALDGMEERMRNAGDTANEAANQATYNWAVAHGILEETGDAAAGVADEIDQIAAETEDAVAKIQEMNAAFAEELADVLKQRMRQDIDQAIAISRRREDIERRALERLNDIYKDAAKDRAQIMADIAKAEREAIEGAYEQRADRERQYRQQLIDIEVSYQRQLQDIQSGYEYELTELVRRNDAVSILRLQRQTNERIRQAKLGRDREKEDAASGYQRDMEELEINLARRREELRQDAQERLQEFEESLQEQLQAYQENLAQEHAELERSLEQQREDMERHREWEDEDRLAAHRVELEELGQHFAGLATITDSGLRSLLERHGGAIQNLTDMWSAYYSWKRQATATDLGGGYGGGLPGWEGGVTDLPESTQGYQSGGFGITQRPTTIRVGERGPEAFAAIPLRSGSANVRHSFSDVNVNLHGVTPQTEAQLQPILMEAFMGIVQAVKSQVAAGA